MDVERTTLVIPRGSALDVVRKHHWGDRLIVGALTIISCAYIVWRYRTAWFFGDEWSFIVDRRGMWAQGRFADALLTPHNEHWATLPIVIYSAVFKVFALSSYRPYLIMLMTVHALTVMALHSVLRRLNVGRDASIGGSVLFALFGVGAENLSWAFQIGFIGSVGLGLTQILAVTHPGSSKRARLIPAVIGPMLGVANVMTSGVAVPIIVGVGAILVLSRHYRLLIANVGVPAVVYLSWFLTYGHSGTSVAPRPAMYTGYIQRGVFATLESTTQLKGAGAILCIAMIIAVSRWWPRREHHAIVLGSLITIVAMYAVFAVGRAAFGNDQAVSSRYLYCSGAFAIGPLILMAQTLIHSKRMAHWVTTGVLGLSIFGNASEINLFADGRLGLVNGSKQRIMATAARTDLQQLGGDVVPDPEYTPGLHAPGLAVLVRGGLLKVAPPRLAAIQPD
jgi:hypothetical protein